MKENRTVSAINRYIILIVTMLSFYACNNTQKQLNPSQIINYVNDNKNGLNKEKQLQDFYFEAKYRPQVYENALAINKGKSFDREKIDDFYYFTLKVGSHVKGQDITKWNASGMEDIQRNIYYLSYTLQKDIKLVDGQDTLDCVYYVFERSFDLANHRIINVGFAPKKWSTATKTLIINGDFFDTSPIKLKFKSADLEKIPSLKYTTAVNQKSIKIRKEERHLKSNAIKRFAVESHISQISSSILVFKNELEPILNRLKISSFRETSFILKSKWYVANKEFRHPERSVGSEILHLSRVIVGMKSEIFNLSFTIFGLDKKQVSGLFTLDMNDDFNLTKNVVKNNHSSINLSKN